MGARFALLAVGLLSGLALGSDPTPDGTGAMPPRAHTDQHSSVRGPSVLGSDEVPVVEPVSIPITLSFRPTRIQDLIGTAWTRAGEEPAKGAGSGWVLTDPVAAHRSLIQQARSPRIWTQPTPRRVMGVSPFDTDWLGSGIVPDESGSLIGGDETLGVSYTAFRRAAAQRESGPFRVTRTVGLGDGAAERSGDLAPSEGDDRYGFAESGGEFDLYEISMTLPAASVGAFSVNWIGGLRAVRADVSQERVDEGSDGETISTLDTARGTVAVPIVGTGVSWSLSRTVELIGHATTHTYSGENSLVDLTAAASIRLTPQMDLQAGYQDVRGRFDVRGIDAELDQSGLFARFRIRF